MELPALRPGTVVGHYRVLSSIGAGGMGEVYLAEDDRLGRKVALKVLPSQFLTDAGRRSRFEREARAASALNHPAILTIHEFGEQDGIYFIATEFIEGATLRERLERGQLKLREVLDISGQIAGALAAAHAAGIVHRDLKPENIMLRPDGFVKVLDFGLAKITDGDASDSEATIQRATDPGTILGTVHYMSPEQAKGKNVDARSDIFSLGAMLYEMVTGRVPFAGETSSHIVVSIIERDPLALTRYVPETPAELQRIVTKALAKDRDDRYQVVKDLMLDLRSLRQSIESGTQSEPAAVASVAGPLHTVSSAEYLISGIRTHKRAAFAGALLLIALVTGIMFAPSLLRDAESGERIPIAVTDFVNQTSDKELDSLSGMLITSLEQSRRLSVMTRSRMFDVLRKLGKDNVERIDESLGREIARSENVNALVTASVSRFGELYIVDLKVLDPTTNDYTFAGKEEGKGKENIPRMLDRLAEKVRASMKERPHDIASAATDVQRSTTSNLQAYQHYFRGEQLIGQLKLEDAIVELKQAVAADPRFGVAWYRLAYATSWSGGEEAKSHMANAMRYSREAPEKERLMMRAAEGQIDGDYRRAIALYRQVLARYPDEGEASYIIGDLSYHIGDYATAREFLLGRLAVDPAHTRAHQHLIWTEGGSGNAEGAVARARVFYRDVPGSTSASTLMVALRNAGRHDEAGELARDAVQRFAENESVVEQAVATLADVGDFDTPGTIINTYRSSGKATRQVSADVCAAEVAVVQGRYRDADALLRKAHAAAIDNAMPTRASELASRRAMILAWSGRAADARQAAAEARSDPASMEVLSWEALLPAALFLNDFDAADAASVHVRTGLPGIPAFTSSARLWQSGDTRGAVKAARAGTNQFAGHWFLWHVIARAELADGNLAEAEDAALRLSRSGSALFSQEASYILGRVAEARGTTAEARKHYQAFVTKWRDGDADLPDLADTKARLAKLGG